MLSEHRYLAIVRASAWYDLVVTAGFATPFTLGLILWAVGSVHGALGFPGAVAALDVWGILFANLMGSVVVVWSLVRLHLNLAILGRYDLVGRILFAFWQITALAYGASWVIILFLVIEIGFGILQALPYRRAVQVQQ